MSRLESAPILISGILGTVYIPDVDFIATQNTPGAVNILWLSGLPQPTEAQLNAVVWNPTIAATFQAQQASKQVGRITPVRLGVNRVNSTVNFADCTGIEWQLAPNSHYAFQIVGAYIAAVGTTGLQIGVNGPASPSLVRVVGNIATSASASLNGVASAYDTAIAATASGGSTPLPFWLDGNISTGVNGGLFVLRFRSEIAGSAVTILSGSYGLLYGIN